MKLVGPSAFLPPSARRSLPLLLGMIVAACALPVADPATLDIPAEIPEEKLLSDRPLGWGAFGDLMQLELSFHDLDTDATVYVTGPYELIYWDDEQIDLVGNLFPDTGDARLTLMQRDDEVWAHLRLSNAEYLTRVE